MKELHQRLCNCPKRHSAVGYNLEDKTIHFSANSAVVLHLPAMQVVVAPTRYKTAGESFPIHYLYNLEIPHYKRYQQFCRHVYFKHDVMSFIFFVWSRPPQGRRPIVFYHAPSQSITQTFISNTKMMKEYVDRWTINLPNRVLVQ